MKLRPLLLFLPVPLLCALGAWGSARLADRVGASLGRALSAVADFVVSVERPQGRVGEPAEDEPIDTGLMPVSVAAPADSPPARTGRTARKSAAKQKPTQRVLFVSAETVLKLASSRAQPRGVAVPASGSRPAGLRLSRVAALGIGLKDGDVLTRAVGQPALSSSAVIQAVLRARAKRARVLEGEFWRSGERWTLQVEQPYLERDGSLSR